MNGIVEEASTVQVENPTDLTMKVENALSAFDARIEILSCLEGVTQNLLLSKNISTLFLNVKRVAKISGMLKAWKRLKLP